jgi:hypothetical protein
MLTDWMLAMQSWALMACNQQRQQQQQASTASTKHKHVRVIKHSGGTCRHGLCKHIMHRCLAHLRT